MKILGIDPGSSLTGYGVVEVMGGKMSAEAYGALDFTGLPETERIQKLYNSVQEIILKHKPDRVALESLFFSKNKKTALMVSETRGIIKLAAVEAGVPLYEYRPAQVKQAISTYGGAQKAEVQKMVAILLKLDEEPSPDDVADALAVSICCASHSWVENAS